MARWTIDQPTVRTLDGIVALRVRIVGGHVNILPTDDPVTFEVSDIVGEPILATQEAGILTITYEDLTRDGFMERLRPSRLSGYRHVSQRRATVNLRIPKDCPVEVTTASASVVAAGLSGKTTLRSASGDLTLDDVGGEIEVSTFSGALDVRDVTGSLHFTSANGGLAVAGGQLSDLSAKTGAGQLLADVDVSGAGRVRLATVSGDVALRIPAETSASVELRSATGTLDSAFGLDRQDQRGLSKLRGKVGNGIDPAHITGTTVSGALSLLRRDPEAPAAIPEGRNGQ
ncbi:DUF4097 family beta strand repeat-containing protein [Lipingzhangella sp. LS1_29]|uniref:DUF4097 family beta strand repeat-containing protein n=1 Tax=Lipingzhangella rawalii TaxID=2055835 RepID=A0ABU2H9Q0_9ACTN|nr:DUF4097 family beta strand repeat-containing protein [Lipingzhangella rawalii]MDS1272050.1 DUF4097 family beta strand repeat-containing protein [Lipingzhangella rawalii]